MLVDNDVHRDSRVQKQASSMAERGWDVVLLGRGRPLEPARTWDLGGARVRLVPVPGHLEPKPNDLRRVRWRDPLAYPLVAVAERRRQEVRARQADLRQRLIELAHPTPEASGAPGPSRPAWSLLPGRAELAVRRRWVGLRARHTHALRERRKAADSGLDRFRADLWQRLLGDGAWRRLDPHLWDFDLAYGPVIDRLDPDLVHANDFRMLGVGARAIVRARERGRHVPLVWDAHEFLPGIRPWTPGAAWHAAQRAHERAHASYADAVVTVSDELARLLVAEHDLPVEPTLVLNAPVVPRGAGDTAGPKDAAAVPSLREACRVGADVPLMVYSGAAAPQRGLDVMVEALPHLPGVVCAFVVSAPQSDYVRSLLAKARSLGVVDRVRLAPYVPFDQVVPYLSGADLGVIPLEHWPNHEIALITKFFEYSHARLPIVVSDVRSMARTVSETGQGEVFTAGDVESFVAATRAVLADPQRYRAAYTPSLLEAWTWDAQADVLDGVYRSLLARS